MISTRLLGTVLLLSLAGCRSGRSPAGLAGIPPEGHVRILAKKVREDAKVYQWQWTIIGDRNWRTPSGDGWTFRLTNSYPLNSRDGTGGTHIWECTVTVEEPPPSQAGGGLRRTVKLRGSNAGQFGSEVGVGAQGTPISRAVETLQSSDATVSIPARVPLARVAGRAVELHVEL